MSDKTNRRALKRQYLETKTRAGVYLIKNLENGHWLLSGSNNVTAAINRHCFEMKTGKNANRLMNQDWKTFGEAAFSCEVLDRVEFRDEEGFSVEDELASLVLLWREELALEESLSYSKKALRKAT